MNETGRGPGRVLLELRYTVANQQGGVQFGRRTTPTMRTFASSRMEGQSKSRDASWYIVFPS